MDAAKFDALENLVIEVDGQGAPSAEQQAAAQAAQALDAGSREWGMVAYVIGNGLALIAPELKQVYTEEACMGWGRSMMPVAEKYGWNDPGSVPEIGLCIASMSLGVPSFLAIRERVRELKAAKLAAEAASAAASKAPAGATDGS